MSATSLRGAHVVVTGGAGFIGSHLVRELARRGAARITVIDSLRYGDVSNLGASLPQVQLVRHTLGEGPREPVREALRGAELLVHLAAEKHNQSKDDPTRVLRANVEGSLALFEEAGRAGVRKVVFSSSLYAYGRLEGGAMVETELPAPRTVYGVSKLAGEHLLAYQAARSGFRYDVLRYFFVYGPRQYAGMGYKSVILKNAERLLAGLAPTVYGDGQQALDYVYVDDVVEVTLRALTSERSGRTLNVGSGEPTTVLALLQRLTEVSGSARSLEFQPADWTAGTRRFADVERTARELGWRACTPLTEGLTRTYRWLAAQGHGDAQGADEPGAP